MLRVTAEDFNLQASRYQDVALQQPVAITRGGEERVVIVSAEEYYRLKRRDRQVLTAAQLTQADIDAIEATRAPESSKAFDDELNA